MPNPVLNEKNFRRALDEDDAGWASPSGGAPLATGTGTATGPGPGAPAPAAPDSPFPAPVPGTGRGRGGRLGGGWGGGGWGGGGRWGGGGGRGGRWNQPVNDGPISPYTSVTEETMTRAGVASATGVLFVLLVAAGALGWRAVHSTPDNVQFPGWLPVAMIGALALALVSAFKPKLARVTAPIYAIGEGFVLGAISKVFESQWNGIVLNAVLLTAGVFLGMWFIYATKLIRVTDRLRRMVMAATFAVLITYGINLLLRLFGTDLPFLHTGGAGSVLVSLVIVGIAAFNLLLDFDFIDRGVQGGLPKWMEWYAAFGLMVTIVWLYLEILRLLAELQGRRR